MDGTTQRTRPLARPPVAPLNLSNMSVDKLIAQPLSPQVVNELIKKLQSGGAPGDTADVLCRLVEAMTNDKLDLSADLRNDLTNAVDNFFGFGDLFNGKLKSAPEEEVLLLIHYSWGLGNENLGARALEEAILKRYDSALVGRLFNNVIHYKGVNALPPELKTEYGQEMKNWSSHGEVKQRQAIVTWLALRIVSVKGSVDSANNPTQPGGPPGALQAEPSNKPSTMPLSTMPVYKLKKEDLKPEVVNELINRLNKPKTARDATDILRRLVEATTNRNLPEDSRKDATKALDTYLELDALNVKLEKAKNSEDILTLINCVLYAWGIDISAACGQDLIEAAKGTCLGKFTAPSDHRSANFSFNNFLRIRVSSKLPAELKSEYDEIVNSDIDYTDKQQRFRSWGTERL